MTTTGLTIHIRGEGEPGSRDEASILLADVYSFLGRIDWGVYTQSDLEAAGLRERIAALAASTGADASKQKESTYGNR